MFWLQLALDILVSLIIGAVVCLSFVTFIMIVFSEYLK